MLIDGADLDHPYVRPGWQRRRIGLALLTTAEALSPQRLELWTFQRNTNARAFDEAHGFRAVAYTDECNEENEPDVKYEWTGFGAPPKSGWAKLVPELLVSDIGTSLKFRCDRLGFAIAYRRPEEAFAYLERPEGVQIMLSQRSGKWETAPRDRAYGRGAMFQVYVTSIEPVQRSLEVAGWPLYAGPREVWREVGDRQAGQREIFVLDPDGYLVMVADDVGERPLSEARS